VVDKKKKINLNIIREIVFVSKNEERRSSADSKPLDSISK